jgi:tetratricopeptide (TPR) repeat protein
MRVTRAVQGQHEKKKGRPLAPRFFDRPTQPHPITPQVLIRRELEEAAKVLGERVRTGDASPADSFELGVILLRKKLYTSALKSLDRARATWDGADADLAQVLNAIGYANFQLNKLDAAVAAYKEAVALQPGYVIAWNNLGDAHEKRGDWGDALDAYTATLALDPGNAVAKARAEACKARAEAAKSVK